MVRVRLVVYDLSRGMAMIMSPALLGQQIEAIYHCGLLVFNREYFYGGGINSLPESHFASSHGLPPIRHEEMGDTSKTQQELESFLRSISHRFTSLSYNLLTNNCNHFCNEVCQFLTGHGIPDAIVNLPLRVFSTPGGQALRPMFESIQAQINSGMQGAGLDPFGSIRPSTSPPPSVSPTAHTSRPRPPTLEKSPLLSIDNSAVVTLGGKIRDKSAILSAEDKLLLDKIITVLSETPLDIDSAAFLELSRKGETFVLLKRVVNESPVTQTAALFLLRIFLASKDLPPEATETVIELTVLLQRPELPKAATVMAICAVANWLLFPRLSEIGEASDLVLDLTSRFLASEAVEVRQISSALAYNVALHATKDGRLAAEWVMRHEHEVHAHAVQLVCSTLESIGSETDASALHRRLAAAFRILIAHDNEGSTRQNAAVNLVVELGFGDGLKSLAASSILTPVTKSILDSLLFLLKLK